MQQRRSASPTDRNARLESSGNHQGTQADWLTKKFDHGAKTFAKVVAGCREHFGDAHEDTCSGAFVDAEAVLRECLSLREKLQPDAWSTFSIKSQLGGALFGQKKLAEAEPLLVKGYEGLKQREAKIPPAARPRLIEALERLVEFSEAAGKKNELATWKKELEALKQPKAADQPKNQP